MKHRSLIVGLTIATMLGVFSYFNSNVILQGRLIGNLMPAIGYGGLLLIVLCLNPLLVRFRAGWELSRKNLVVICSLTIVAGTIAGWGLLEFLPTSLMLPHHEANIRPGWQNAKVLDDMPERMMPQVTLENQTEVLGTFMRSARTGSEHISFSDVPWHVWIRPLLFWIPLLLTITIGLIALAVVLHRQWAHHEHLPYPIATVAQSFLPDKGTLLNDTLRNRAFWVAAGIIAMVFLHNWSVKAFGEYLPKVPLAIDMAGFKELFPTISAGGGSGLFTPRVIPIVVGLAFFLASDFSFSMGIMPWVFCLVYGVLIQLGVPVTAGNHFTPRVEASMFLGGYVGIFLLAIYSGRHYYYNVLRAGVGLPVKGETQSHEVWGIRIFLLATLLFVVQLIAVGLEWHFALAYTGISVIVWVGVSRAVAETGAIEIGSQIFPCAVMLTFLGPFAVGPKMLLIMSLMSTVIMGAPGWTPIAYVSQAFKLADSADVNIGRLARQMVLALLVCSAVAVAAMLYWQYDSGVGKKSWNTVLAVMPYDNIVEVKYRLESQGTLEEARVAGPVDRLRRATPHKACLTAFLIVLAAVIGCFIARLCFSSWPIHPIVFLFLAGAQAKTFAFSFLLGWLIKAIVIRYGGPNAYGKVKPVMIGLIAGSLCSKLLIQIVGLAYYFVAGERITE